MPTSGSSTGCSPAPRYGERWARHWLDVAGYADSDGYTARDDVRKFAYKYRDYLVRSLNADRPWDELIREQLAGDEMVKPPYANLAPADVDKLVATGFLRMAPDGTGGTSRSTDHGAERRDRRDDQDRLDVAAGPDRRLCPVPRPPLRPDLARRTITGSAPCSSRPYDPNDWRAAAARLVSLWTDADRQPRRRGPMPRSQRSPGERSAAVEELVKKVLERELAAAPEDLREQLRAARETPPAKRIGGAEGNSSRTTRGSTSARATSPSTTPAAPTAIVRRHLPPDGARPRQGGPAEDAVAGPDRGPRPGARDAPVRPGRPAAAPAGRRPGRADGAGRRDGRPADPAPTTPALPTTGRRLAYAAHLTERPASAGRAGAGQPRLDAPFRPRAGRDPRRLRRPRRARPTHPELLDWLADDFVRGGWTLKRLHRLIVTSTAYRQSSRRDARLRRRRPREPPARPGPGPAAGGRGGARRDRCSPPAAWSRGCSARRPRSPPTSPAR